MKAVVRTCKIFILTVSGRMESGWIGNRYAQRKCSEETTNRINVPYPLLTVL